jgi:hypothetical protein
MSSNLGVDTDGPSPISPADLAGDAPPGVPSLDFSAAVDAAGPMSCPCNKGSYCDLATNTCMPGCAFDSDCTTAHCNTATHQCYTPGVTCGTKTCMPTEQCCVTAGMPTCAASCASDMGSITVSCQGPSDCSGGTPVCCAHVTLSSFPACAYDAVVQCDATCTFTFPACGGSGQAEVCAKKTDCKDPMAANCCTFSFQGQTSSLCVSDSAKGFATSCL